jgi:DNA mismatch repair ATPase MutS
MKTYLQICRQNREAIVLVRLREGYEALMQHALTVATALKRPMRSRTNSPMCAIPAAEIEDACARLRELGHEVILADYS